MRAAVVLPGLFLAACAVQAAAGPVASPPPAITDEAIRQAVREVLAEKPENPRRHEANTVRGNKYQVFAEQFDEAKVPDCLHPDGLKRQPPHIGPISFAYLYAVPFVVLAKIRGTCN